MGTQRYNSLAIFLLIFLFFGCEKQKAPIMPEENPFAKPGDLPTQISLLSHDFILKLGITDTQGNPTAIIHRGDTLVVTNWIINTRNREYPVMVKDSGPLLENVIFLGKQRMVGNLEVV